MKNWKTFPLLFPLINTQTQKEPWQIPTTKVLYYYIIYYSY
nr:MAG TPA: hypothetical protein [Caudoviricetes sp.]